MDYQHLAYLIKLSTKTTILDLFGPCIVITKNFNYDLTPIHLKIGGFGYYQNLLTFHILLASCWQIAHRKWKSKLVKCLKRRLQKMVKKSIKAVNWRQLNEGERVIEGDMAIMNVTCYLCFCDIANTNYLWSSMLFEVVIWANLWFLFLKKASYLKFLFFICKKKKHLCGTSF
jgi:hypothetical protein